MNGRTGVAIIDAVRSTVGGWLDDTYSKIKNRICKLYNMATSKEPLMQRARKVLEAIMDDIFRYVVIIALILLAFWVGLKILYYFISIIAPKHEIVFVTDDQTDARAKQATQILSAKLRRLQSYTKQSPTGYGFLQLPALGAVPQEAQKQLGTLGNLNNIPIKIKDVDVNAIIKAVSELLSPPRYELRVHTIDLPDALEVSCDLFYGDKQEANWRSRARKSGNNEADGNESTSAANNNAGNLAASNPQTKMGAQAGADNSAKPPDFDRLLDDVLFQMTYDFMTKEEFEGWGISRPEGNYKPENWQTLQAYTRGVQALTAYQQNLDNKDLDEALSFLERLPIVAPQNAYGLYYYGLALSENRQEDEAVAVFQQLQRLLTNKPETKLSLPKEMTLTPPAHAGDAATDASSAEPAPDSSAAPSPSASPGTRTQPRAGAEKMYYEAKFNEATARLKFYRRKAGQQAAETLNELINELVAKRAGTDISDDDRWYYGKLLAISYAQLAYTDGTLLSMMHDDNPPRMTEIPEEIKKKWLAITENIEKAEQEFQVSLQGCWEQKKKTPEEQEQLKREKSDIEFRIKNAAGYSLYRWAQYWAELGDKDKLKEAHDEGMKVFHDLCNRAIGYLEQANLARPNHYEVLQNMAMIYEDKKYDPDGVYLEKAESLYLQTTKFVPRDYYQYEHLALIQWRRLELASPASNPALIKSGTGYGLKALDLRPHATTALFTMARFNVKAWEDAKDKTSDEARKSADAAVSYFKQALAIRPNNSDFLNEYADALLTMANPETTDAKLAIEHGVALLDLAKHEWIAAEQRKRLLEQSKADKLGEMEKTEAEQKKRLLSHAVKMLMQAMALTVAKDTEEKKQLNTKAQTLLDEARALLNDETTSESSRAAVEAGSTLLDMARQEGMEEKQKRTLLEQAIKLLTKAIELTRAKDTQARKELNDKAQTLLDEANKLLNPPA